MTGGEWFVVGIVVLVLWGLANQPKNRPRVQPGPYPIEIVDAINQLISQLKPSPWYHGEAEKVARKLRNYLNRARYITPSIRQNIPEIESHVVAGGVGKGTAILYSDQSFCKNDMDLVLNLGNSKSSYSNVLKAIEIPLSELDEISGIIVRQFSVEFNIWIKHLGDVKVDLLVAEKSEDCIEVVVDMKGDEKKQKQLLIERNKRLSCTLAEKTVELIQSYVQDEYVLQIVVLAKHWNSMLDMRQLGYVPARSYIVEILAIYANQNAAGIRSSKDIVSGFRRFLEKMENFRKLDVDLEKQKLTKAAKAFKKPIIRDPVNGMNNLTEGVPIKAMEIWEDQAKKTLQVLKRLRNETLDVEEQSEIIDAIFSQKS